MMDQGSALTNLQAEYQQVCSNFRLLTDIRFKLLALLPIGTGAGVALTMSNQSSVSNPLVGLFGLLVTSSAALYNLRNDQLYNALIGRAAHLERLLELKEGAFAQRPRVWQWAGPFKVSHGQIWWIYLGSLAAWLYVILHGLNLPWSCISSSVPSQLLEGASAAVLILLLALLVRFQENKTSNRLKNAAHKSVRALRQIPLSPSPNNEKDWRPLLKHTSVLAGGRAKEKEMKKLEKRLLFYLQDDMADTYWDKPAVGQKPNARAAAQLLSLVTDLPSRWIFDVTSGRRG